MICGFLGELKQGKKEKLMLGMSETLKPYHTPFGCLNEEGANYLGMISKASATKTSLTALAITFITMIINIKFI